MHASHRVEMCGLSYVRLKSRKAQPINSGRVIQAKIDARVFSVISNFTRPPHGDRGAEAGGWTKPTRDRSLARNDLDRFHRGYRRRHGDAGDRRTRRRPHHQPLQYVRESREPRRGRRVRYPTDAPVAWSAKSRAPSALSSSPTPRVAEGALMPRARAPSEKLPVSAVATKTLRDCSRSMPFQCFNSQN